MLQSDRDQAVLELSHLHQHCRELEGRITRMVDEQQEQRVEHTHHENGVLLKNISVILGVSIGALIIVTALSHWLNAKPVQEVSAKTLSASTSEAIKRAGETAVTKVSSHAAKLTNKAASAVSKLTGSM